MIEQPNPLTHTAMRTAGTESRGDLLPPGGGQCRGTRTDVALIDRQYLRTPFHGSRRMPAWLQSQSHVVNRKRVQRLMRLMAFNVGREQGDHPPAH
jgi:hypothetical protein